ncbi:hypothetical protein BXZ70DRAFT_901408 [Cristinia sonorae]|uniref:Csf1 N-terminal domain-containing protein n=1 Tax=Cristinia sonorae TaxID=1940300 RepID=A0A8K0XKA9_9AGAR|nr:hypothetical protein BXZ70DRAFT_901408 [Cristinia sonorae]
MLNFNVVLLIVCICIALGLIAYLFYWNRLLGLIFGLVFRLYFWNQNESSVWLELGSIHFSVLGGSILFKDLRYHSSNQTIKIVKGQVSWRYWIRAPAEEEDLIQAQVIGQSSPLKVRSPPTCRVHVKIQGLEWFLYNRTAAYDSIISAMETSMSHAPDSARPSGDGGRSSLRKMFSGTSVVPPESSLGHPVSLFSSFIDKTPNFIKRAFAWVASQLPNFDPKDLLPLSIEATTAAITLGNASTPSLLVAEFRRAQGVFGVVPAKSKHDLYRQLLSFTFDNASLRLAENDRFSGTMREKGQKVHDFIGNSNPQALRRSTYLSYTFFQKLWRKMRLWEVISPRSRFRLFNNHDDSWSRRRSRKVTEEETPVGVDFSHLEYATARKILETPVLELSYYVDIPGTVPIRSEPTTTGDPLDIGNGDSAPEWGIDLAIIGGTIRYGPWADRQRTRLQQTFFPSAFSSAEPEPRLRPGDTRKWTAMRIFVELRDDVVLQIPFREASKNWQWDGKAEIPERPRIREAASIHIKASDASTISYTMPFVASPTGYDPSLEIHLDTLTVTSSLNDIRLITAESCRASEMPSPLAWDGARTWNFSISLRQPVLYLLRDHVNMFTDLGKDWSSGPPTSYNCFIPMQYDISLEMQNYELNLYLNDQNIIDKPLIREQNALLTLKGTSFKNGVKIPLNQFRPMATTISFWVDVPAIEVQLTLPRWNSHSLFPSPHRNHIGRIGHLSLEASYRYFAEVHPENIDNLKLRFTARDVVYKACGYTIRHFMSLRENYFGSFTHFSTLEEYLHKRDRGRPVGDPIQLQYREGNSNAMTVELDLAIESSAMIMPAGLPGYESFSVKAAHNLDNIDMGACAVLVIPDLQLRLRTHDYYMEMALNIDTVIGRADEHCSAKLFTSPSSYLKGQEDLVIDGISITANRLFGPQPYTATYLCIWEIHVVNINALLSASQSRIFQAAGDAFSLHFSDPLNSPAAEFAVPTDPDVTFLKVCLGSVNVVWNVDSAAVEFALPEGLRIDTNDLAGKTYGKVTSLRIPQASLKTLLASPSSASVWYEAMSVTADGNLDIYSAPPGWREKAAAQTAFISRQDSHTLRARFMYMSESRVDHDQLVSGRGMIDNEIYLPQLRIPTLASSRNTPYYRSSGQPSPMNRENSRVQSDSEDEVDPELDYDTQLAKSRPYKSFVIREENESISSGDESDNDGLTDYSTDTDDLHSMHDYYGSWPLLADYTYWTARYTSHCLQKPTLWSQTPFSLSRDCSFRSRPSIRRQRHSRHSEFISNSRDPEKDKDITIIRFSSEQGISIFLTPLAIPATEHLLKDLSTHNLSPELRFDALMSQHIRSFSLTAEKFRKLLVFDVSIPLVDVTLSQAVSPMDNGNLVRDHPPRNDVLSSLVLEIQDISSKGQVESGVGLATDVSLSGSFGFANVKLLDREASMTSRDVSHAACNLKAGYSSVTLLDGKATLDLGRIGLEIEHSAPELLLASSASVARCADRVKAALNGPSELDVYRQLIFEVMNFSRDRSIIDPFSTIQPSFLIQSGRPHDIRTDGAFRFLIYLRNCSRYLEPDERRAVLDLPHCGRPPVSTEELQDAVAAQMDQSDMDLQASTLGRRSILQDLVPGLGVPATQVAPHKKLFENAILLLKHLRLSISHPQDNAYSEVYLRKVMISVSSRMAWVSQPGNPMKQSSTSLRSREHLNTRQVALLLSTGDIGVSVSPQLLGFLQVVIRVQRHYMSTASRSPVNTQVSPKPNSKPPPFYQIDVVLSSRSLRFKAAAESLVIEYKASGVTYTSTTLAKHVPHSRMAWDLSMNHAVAFDEIRLQACSLGEMAKPRDYTVLASISVTGGNVSTVLRQEALTRPSVRGVFNVQGIHLNVPRSAMRLYRFMQDWQADYLPGLHATTKALLTELGNGTGKPSSISSRTSSHAMQPALQLHVSVSSLRVSLQVMHGTWLSWEVVKTMAYLTASNISQKRTYQFGGQVRSQCFSISSRNAQDSTPGIRVELKLPTLSMTGNHDGHRICGTALVEFFKLTVKPSDWDTLLSVQQKFGQDFHDLMTVIADTRQKKAAAPLPSEPPQPKAGLQYEVSFKMQGFQVGLEGHASTLFLECDDIHGGISEESQSQWRITLRDLALSLAANAKLLSHKSAFDRGRRSAFVIVDCALTMQSNVPPTTKRVYFELTKMHAVMQPSSIGELGDFVDHLQAEVLVRKEKRAKELEEFKAKTKKVMHTFDVKIGDPQAREEEDWWDKYILHLKINNFSIAFPLILTQDVQLPRSGSADEVAVRAFLFSIRSIVFGTHRGESGEVTMSGFSFQFVPSFKQSNPDDFAGDRHFTRNRLLYPEMKAQIRTERASDSRRVYLTADVDGFVLDIDSTMPDYVHSLIDVYQQGKERVERLANTMPRTVVEVDSPSPPEVTTASDDYGALPTSSVLASLTFASGKVRMFCDSHTSSSRVRAVSLFRREPTDEQSRDMGAEVFNLPVVSVWCEFRATPAASKLPGSRPASEPSTLLFKSTIHSSQNTLRPTLLPFLSEFVGRIEDRMRKTTWRDSHASSASQDYPMITQENRTDQVAETVSSMQISLSLRIDQSKLELTCQPDVNVIAGLHWESGGFMLNISPGARQVTLSGSVGGLTAGLKHGFLSEDCVKLNARDLAFSLNYSKSDGKGADSSSLSLIVDTEISGGVRFSRLQDVLCFKAVWLDRIPVLRSQTSLPSSAVTKSASHLSAMSAPQTNQELVTSVIVRLRSIRLDVDLGQSISVVKLLLRSGVLRTKVTETYTALSLSVADFSVDAAGNLSGHLDVPDFRFQTLRRAEYDPNDVVGGRMLDLSMTSGPLNLELDSEFHKLIYYRAEPLEVLIYDDWSQLSSKLTEQERRILLAFTVSGTDVMAMMNVGTIPKLVSYATKFAMNLEVQKEGASRESKAFRMAMVPRHDNLSAVANAMLSTARSRIKEAGSSFAYAVGQRLSLRLNVLQLVVFPRTMRDHEVAHFIGRGVHARLDRMAESVSFPGTRTLHLSFSSMTISKMSQLNHALATKEKITDCQQWFGLLSKGASEATIFGLPSMDMYMKSDENLVDNVRTIEYDFSSSFKSRDDRKDQEDIYISLNMSLYSWLTILRKTFAREMDQVQAVADLQRNLTTSLSAGPTIQRKKPPEPLSIITEHGPLKDSPEPMQSPLPHTSSSTPTHDKAPPIPANEVVTSPTLKPISQGTATLVASEQQPPEPSSAAAPPGTMSSKPVIIYKPRERHIERLTMRQLGEATPDVMHPFFMKRAGFNLEDSLPQYVHEYATLPTEEIMKALLKLYSRQLKAEPAKSPKG